MTYRRPRQRWSYPEFVLVGLLGAGSQGCISASLATSTGPRPPGQPWSTAATQKAHVGEEVLFDFVLTDPLGRFLMPEHVADYAVLTIGEDRVETESDPSGHFAFSYKIAKTRPGEKIRIRSAAFRQLGRRDYMKVQNRWLKAESPADESDRIIAEDTLNLEVYQAVVDLTLDGSADELDAESGVLRFRRLDGKTARVYVSRAGRRGFELSGPDQAGGYRVTFRPEGADLNPTGTTDVELTIDDRGGRRHSASMVLPTP